MVYIFFKQYTIKVTLITDNAAGLCYMMALMELSGTGPSATELPGAELSGTRHFATEFPEAELSAMELASAGFPFCACISYLKTQEFPDEERKNRLADSLFFYL